MIHLLTLNLATALVVHVAGVVFIIETMLRKEDRSGRLWALAFLAAMLASESYYVWVSSIGAWWASAVGNGSFIASLGLIWLGCRTFNDRPNQRHGLLVGVLAVAAAITTLMGGPEGDKFSGAWLFFTVGALFTGLAALQCTRAPMRRYGTSLGLAAMLTVASAFFIARLFGMLFIGVDHELYRVFLGEEVAAALVIVLTIIAVMVASVLRAEHVRMRGADEASLLAISPDGVLLRATFQRVLGGRLMRANRREELFSVLAIRIDALPRIATAFGEDEAEHVRLTVRAAARRLSPTSGVLGVEDDGTLLLAFQPTSLAAARQLAGRVHRAMLDQLRIAGAIVMPTIGMGVSLTSVVGYDHRAIIDAAIRAAQRAIRNDDASVVIAGVEDAQAGALQGRR